MGIGVLVAAAELAATDGDVEPPEALELPDPALGELDDELQPANMSPTAAAVMRSKSASACRTPRLGGVTFWATAPR